MRPVEEAVVAARCGVSVWVGVLAWVCAVLTMRKELVQA